VPAPRSVLASLVQALAPQGVIEISVPCGSDTEESLRSPDWRARKDALHPLEHVNCFTPSSLATLCNAFELEPLGPKALGMESGGLAVAAVRALRKVARGEMPWHPQRPGTSCLFRRAADKADGAPKPTRKAV
jgi:hypothetical protein